MRAPPIRTLHRWTMVVAGLLLVYVAGTGILIQVIDLNALYGHQVASAPDMQSIHDGIYGPPGFSVMDVADHSAARLPDTPSADQMLATVMIAARASAPTQVLNWVELRMDGQTPVGIVALVGEQSGSLKFNALTGAALGAVEQHGFFGMPGGPRSLHDTVKNLHRGSVLGTMGLVLNLVVGVALLFLVISGLIVYFRMLAARMKAGRGQWFWQ